MTYRAPLGLALILIGCASEVITDDGDGPTGGTGPVAGSATTGGSSSGTGGGPGTGGNSGTGGSLVDGGSAGLGGAPVDGGATVGGEGGEGGAGGEPEPGPCTTRVGYGSTWIKGDRETTFDLVKGDVRWDGQCIDQGSNSYAVLSNGWKPYFTGHAACIISLDHQNCENVPASCSTRIGYGDRWQAPSNHPNRYDQVTGAVTWNGTCSASGANSAARFSNNWNPHFEGADSCSLGFSYQECGGLYQNPVIPAGCADPGVLEVDGTYYVTCTGGGASTAFSLRASPDLVNYTSAGHIFTSTTKPAWTTGDYWAPEIHRVGERFVAYYTARHTDGRLSIGAAYAESPLGPYTDLGAPLIQEPGIGAIDATYFVDGAGQPYLLWKIDGNAKNQPTPIYGQKLAADGLSLTGSRTELITNDLAWEGHVVEGPWVIREGDYYYLFYSGNSYANETYAVGVARSQSPLGPYVKHGDPILTSNERWIGPGHCSVVRGPRGGWQMVYHAWPEPRVGGRVTLVDPIGWQDGWPRMLQTPSLRSIPMP